MVEIVNGSRVRFAGSLEDIAGEDEDNGDWFDITNLDELWEEGTIFIARGINHESCGGWGDGDEEDRRLMCHLERLDGTSICEDGWNNWWFLLDWLVPAVTCGCREELE